MSNLGWHFVGKTLRDGRPIPRDGVWLDHDGPIVICRSGLHGSRLPWHALRYAPGDVLCRVEFDGIVDEHDDKLVARRRRILCRADISETLRYFTRMRALSVAHLYDISDVVLGHLMTGDGHVSAAAWAAVWATVAAESAFSAAWDAALAAAGREFDSLVYEQFGMGGSDAE